MEEELGLGTKSVPLERRRKITLKVYKMKVKIILILH
jgi:hypothetical protein